MPLKTSFSHQLIVDRAKNAVLIWCFLGDRPSFNKDEKNQNSKYKTTKTVNFLRSQPLFVLCSHGALLNLLVTTIV